MCILLFLDGIFCKCLLNPSSLTCLTNASLFIFCLRDLSIYVSGALKPPTITILLFLCLNMLIFALYFSCSYVGCLSTYKWHLLNGLTPLPSPNSRPCLLPIVLKPPLSDTRVATPSHWHGAAFSIPLLSACVSLQLN